jgi:hypothetical protein
MANTTNRNGYSNAKEQAQVTGTALMTRLTKDHFALTQGVADSLVRQGLGEAQLPYLASTCLAINVSPNLLRYTHNIPPVVKALKMVTELGYRAGEDFHVSVFKTNVPTLNEDGEPTDQKAKAPTVVVMMAASRIQENAKQDDRLTGLLHHVETSVIEDQKEARTIFDEHYKGARSFRDAIVAKAELYTYHTRTGQPIGSGKPQIFYGFYAPWTIYEGQEQRDYNEVGKPKDNYQAPDVAQKRAANKAWRSVSRTNYARDDRPADVRLAALMSSAQTKLAIAERIADEHGVDIETAIVDGDQIQEKARKQDKRLTAMMKEPELDDFDRLLMYGEEPKGADVVDGEYKAVGDDDNDNDGDDATTGQDEDATGDDQPIEKHPGYATFSGWANMQQALKWAVDQKVYAKMDEGKPSWVSLVQAYGTYSNDTKIEIHRDWYDFVIAKTEKVPA